MIPDMEFRDWFHKLLKPSYVQVMEREKMVFYSDNFLDIIRNIYFGFRECSFTFDLALLYLSISQGQKLFIVGLLLEDCFLMNNYI